MTTPNGRIMEVHAIERLVAKLRLTREERADVIEGATGQRSLVRLNAYQLDNVRKAFEHRLETTDECGD